MSSLHIVKSDRSGQSSCSPELANTGNSTLQNWSDLLQRSHALDLESVPVVLNSHNWLSNLLLDVVNSLLMANYETVVIDHLLGAINGLLNVDQITLAQGLLNTVQRLLKENASRTSVEDVIATVEASIHQLQAIGSLAGQLPTYFFLMTAADTVDQSPETSAQKPETAGKFALQLVPALR